MIHECVECFEKVSPKFKKSGNKIKKYYNKFCSIGCRVSWLKKYMKKNPTKHLVKTIDLDSPLNEGCRDCGRPIKISSSIFYCKDCSLSKYYHNKMKKLSTERV